MQVISKPNQVPIKAWIDGIEVEEQARKQLDNMAKMPFIHKHIAILPDCHWGMGATVGSVIPTKGAIIPAAVGVDIGCVDFETEFLTDKGWKQINEYVEGDNVFIYNPETFEGYFDIPEAYICRPSEGFYHFKSKYGINQKLSADHRMLTYKSGREREFSKAEVISAKEVFDIHNDRAQGFGNRIKTTPERITNIETSMMISHAEIRLAVMIAADGHIAGDAAVLHFRKTRKFLRALELIEAAGVEPISIKEAFDYTIRIPNIFKDRRLGSPIWWQASATELAVIAEEVLYWDGNHNERCFYTRNEQEADFVQWAFLASGKRSVLRKDVHYRDGKMDYRVYAHENTLVGIKSSPKTPIEFVPSLDGMEYCFTVATGFFLIRRKGVTAITGNCGMIAARTSLTASDLPDNLHGIRTAIEKRIPHGRTNNGREGDRGAWYNLQDDIVSEYKAKGLKDELDKIIEKHPKVGQAAKRAPHHIGTLGTGNHFVEICLDEDDRVWIMLHSGSRGIGNRIGMYFIELAKEDMRKWFVNLPDQDLAYLPQGTDHFDDYMKAVSWAQRFAKLNRQTMMNAALEALRSEIEKPFTSDCEAVNCHHNYVATEKHFGEQVFLTRKGAVSAKEGEMGIIPGSMGAKSFIVRGKGGEAGQQAFFSCSHGAGRAMSRTEAKKRFTIEDHIAAMGNVEARTDEDVIDETPAAYKSIDAVMAAQSDLVDIVHTLKQVVCVKG